MLQRFNIRQSEACDFWNDPIEDAKHTLFVCQNWQTYRQEMNTKTGIEVKPENMVSLMVESEENWRSIEICGQNYARQDPRESEI